MEKRMLWLGVVIMVVGLFSAGALATSLGPPTSSLKQGQFKTGLEYFRSDMDLELTGKVAESESIDFVVGLDQSKTGSYKLVDQTMETKMNKIYANIGYGIVDNWEVFIRLGGVDAELDFEEQSAQYLTYPAYPDADPNRVTTINFDGDFTFAYGFGIKATLWEQSPELKWGGLFQMSWAKIGAKTSGSHVYNYLGTAYPMGSFSESTEFSINEIQIAVGPTWTPSEGFSIYGGPFLQFIDGELIYESSDTENNYSSPTPTALPTITSIEHSKEKRTFDISEDSSFGGYVGAKVNLKEKCDLTAELAFTGDGWGIGAGVALAF
jgi:hypothetical protein